MRVRPWRAVPSSPGAARGGVCGGMKIVFGLCVIFYKLASVKVSAEEYGRSSDVQHGTGWVRWVEVVGEVVGYVCWWKSGF